MHVICDHLKKRAFMLRNAEYQEHGGEKEPAGGSDGSQPERSPNQKGKWRIDGKDRLIGEHCKIQAEGKADSPQDGLKQSGAKPMVFPGKPQQKRRRYHNVGESV